MRSVVTLAVGVALVAALLLVFGATAALAAAPSTLEQEAPTDALVPSAAGAVDISVSARTGFTRTFQWEITKTANANPLSLFAGESDAVSYVVSGKRQAIQTGSHISGTVLITNSSGVTPTVLNTITVQLTSPNVGNVPAECGVTLPHSLDPGAVLECSFRSILPGVSSRPTTTVSVFSDGSATPDMAVTRPPTETRVINEVGFSSVTISDSYAGPLLPVVTGSGATLNFTRTYTRPVECPASPAEYIDGLKQIPLENIATISETNQIAVADVLVDCYAPVVTQQAAGGYTRTWDWSVVKTADTVSGTVPQSGTLPVTYTVAVSNAQADADFAVSGTISVTNQHPAEAMSVSVASNIPGLGPVTLDCGGALNVPAGQTAACGFTAPAPDAAPRDSVATVSFGGGDYVSSVPVTFSLTGEVNACVDVFDDEGTPGDPGDDAQLGTLCRDEAPETFTYSAAPAFTACGAQQFVNTVRLASGETAELESGSWTIDVTVDCTQAATKLLLPIIFDQRSQ